MTAEIQSVCVFCGSRDGIDPEYRTMAISVGEMLARQGLRLVYGAGDVGLMGAVAVAAKNAGGQTFGVIPEHLFAREIGKRDLTTFIVTENMHERKKVMFMNSDAVIVLPGGAGSLDEFYEVLTWRQLGLHTKPIILLNVKGYWDPLIALNRHVVAQGFADKDVLEAVTVVEDIAGVEAVLAG